MTDRYCKTMSWIIDSECLPTSLYLLKRIPYPGYMGVRGNDVAPKFFFHLIHRLARTHHIVDSKAKLLEIQHIHMKKVFVGNATNTLMFRT